MTANPPPRAAPTPDPSAARPVGWAAARLRRADGTHPTQQALLNAAARVFARRGYASSTVGDITAEADVSRAAFYAYFPSKREVFVEVVKSVRDEFLAAHETPDIDNPYELGRVSIQAFLTAHAAHAALVTVIEHEAAGDATIHALWQEMQLRPSRRMARHVEHLQATGQASPTTSPSVLGDIMFAILRHAGNTLPETAEAFTSTVNDLTAIYARLIGIDNTEHE